MGAWPAVTTQWIKASFTDTDAFWAQWDRLNTRYNAAHPMLDSRFVRPLIKHFPQELEVLRGENLGQVTALLLLQNKGRGVVQVFAPSQAQICLCLVPERLDMRALLAALSALQLRLDCWFVDPLFQQGMLDSASYASAQISSINMDIVIDGEFDQYWADRSKNLRKGIKRYLNKIEEQFDDVRFRVLDRPEQIAEAVEDYGLLESQGWKADGGTAVHPENTQGRYYQAMLVDFAAKGNAVVFEIRLGERLVASRLCIYNPECLIILKTTFDESLKEYAFGRVLLFKILVHLFETKTTRRVDFYTNATQDQLRWATAQRPQYHMSHYRRGLGAFGLRPLDMLRSQNTASSIKPGCVEIDYCYDVGTFSEQERELFEVAETPFTTFDWVENFTANVASRLGKVVFICLKIGGKTEAILPLIEKREHGVNILSCFSNYYTPYIGLVSDKSQSRNYFRLIVACAKPYFARFDRLDIMPLVAEQLQAISPALRLDGFTEERYLFSKNWRELDIESYEQFIDKMSGSLRSTIKRKGRKLAAEPGYEIEKISAENAKKLIADYQQVYEKSWKVNEPFPGFIKELIERGVSAGYSRLYVMYHQDKPVAAQFWLVKGQCAYIYKLAYDPEYAHLSVGTLLSDYIFREMITHEGIELVDYLVGNDKYKSDWMSSCRTLYGICAYNRKTPVGWFFIIRKIIKDLTVSRWKAAKARIEEGVDPA